MAVCQIVQDTPDDLEARPHDGIGKGDHLICSASLHCT